MKNELKSRALVAAACLAITAAVVGAGVTAAPPEEPVGGRQAPEARLNGDDVQRPGRTATGGKVVVKTFSELADATGPAPEGVAIVPGG